MLPPERVLVASPEKSRAERKEGGIKMIKLPLFKNDVLIRDYIVVDPNQQNVVDEIYQEWAKREHIATRLQGDLVGSGVPAPANEINASKNEIKEWVKNNYPTVKIIREEL